MNELKKKFENGGYVWYVNSHTDGSGEWLYASDNMIYGQLEEGYDHLKCNKLIALKDAKTAEAVANDSSVEVEILWDEGLTRERWRTLEDLGHSFFESYKPIINYRLKPKQPLTYPTRDELEAENQQLRIDNAEYVHLTSRVLNILDDEDFWDTTSNEGGWHSSLKRDLLRAKVMIISLKF